MYFDEVFRVHSNFKKSGGAKKQENWRIEEMLHCDMITEDRVTILWPDFEFSYALKNCHIGQIVTQLWKVIFEESL